MNHRTGLALAAILIAGPLHAQTTGMAGTAGLVPAAGNPNLSVASVRMDNGIRASKLIGSGVYSEANAQIGTVDDLIMTPDNHVQLAIVSVGGLIGLGGKLVAVPIGQLQRGADNKLTLPGATKDSLSAMPNFVFN